MSVRLGLVAVLAVATVPDAPPRPVAAAGAYDRYRRPEVLVAALGIAPGSRVADVGAGAGYLTLRLAAAAGPGGRVVATDIDAGALATLNAAAEDAVGRAPIATRLVRPDEPALEPGGYDLILLAEVDHLLPDRAAYFRRLVAALAPGGRLAVANRLTFRAAVRAAAAEAGLVELPAAGPSADLPAQFLIFFGRSGVNR